MRVKKDLYFYNQVNKMLDTGSVTLRNKNLAFEILRYARSRNWIVTFKWDIFDNYTLELN